MDKRPGRARPRVVPGDGFRARRDPSCRGVGSVSSAVMGRPYGGWKRLRGEEVGIVAVDTTCRQSPTQRADASMTGVSGATRFGQLVIESRGRRSLIRRCGAMDACVVPAFFSRAATRSLGAPVPATMSPRISVLPKANVPARSTATNVRRPVPARRRSDIWPPPGRSGERRVGASRRQAATT